MKFRAAILDIYGTLLEVSAAPNDADARWDALWRERLGRPPRLTRQEFGTQCEQIIAREHAASRSAGISHPEVFWPKIVSEVVPELNGLTTDAQDEFLFQQAQLWHTVRLMPGAGDALRKLIRGKVLLGLASNSQPYTLRELDDALASTGLARSIFTDALCFFSFEHGFSKPDPCVFGWVASRLQAFQISPGEALVVGDRWDNDIEPARANGFRTWQLTPVPGDGINGGTWDQLRGNLDCR